MSKTPVVCDNGTGFVKLGYAGQYFPEYIFPSMIGTPTMKYSEEFENVDIKKVISVGLALISITPNKFTSRLLLEMKLKNTVICLK